MNHTLLLLLLLPVFPSFTEIWDKNEPLNPILINTPTSTPAPWNDDQLAKQLQYLKTNPDPVVRSRIAFDIGDSYNSGLFSALETALVEEKVPQVRANILMAIGKALSCSKLVHPKTSNKNCVSVKWEMKHYKEIEKCTRSSYEPEALAAKYILNFNKLSDEPVSVVTPVEDEPSFNQALKNLRECKPEEIQKICAAIRVVGRHGGKALMQLEPFVNSKYSPVQLALIDALWKQKDPVSIKIIINLAGLNPNISVPIAAINAMRRNPLPEYAKVLAGGLMYRVGNKMNADPIVRMECCRALTAQKELQDGVLNTLGIIITTPYIKNGKNQNYDNPAVRAAALMTLKKHSDSPAARIKYSEVCSQLEKDGMPVLLKEYFSQIKDGRAPFVLNFISVEMTVKPL